MANKSKSCTRCHKRKAIEEFVPSHRAKDGYMQYCRKCWGKIVSQKKADKKKVVRQDGVTTPSGEGAARVAALDQRIAVANAALNRANGTPAASRSPLRKIVKELHRSLAEQGAEIENITFEDGACRITYRKTETFDL